AGVWRAGEVERPLRVADVHHDLGADFRHFVQRYFVDTKVNLAVIDIAGITLGAGYRDAAAGGQHAAGVAAADHGRNAQFAGDDGGVTGASATVGDNRRGAFHDRFPIGIGHVRDQHVARLHAVHFVDGFDVAHDAGTD